MIGVPRSCPRPWVIMNSMISGVTRSAAAMKSPSFSRSSSSTTITTRPSEIASSASSILENLVKASSACPDLPSCLVESSLSDRSLYCRQGAAKKAQPASSRDGIRGSSIESDRVAAARWALASNWPAWRWHSSPRESAAVRTAGVRRRVEIGVDHPDAFRVALRTAQRDGIDRANACESQVLASPFVFGGGFNHREDARLQRLGPEPASMGYLPVASHRKTTRNSRKADAGDDLDLVVFRVVELEIEAISAPRIRRDAQEDLIKQFGWLDREREPFAKFLQHRLQVADLSFGLVLQIVGAGVQVSACVC